MSVQSTYSNHRDSDSEYIKERKSSTGRKTVSDLVQTDPERREQRKRGIIAPQPALESGRSLTDLNYEKFAKDEK